MRKLEVKCVVVGDSAVGKTSLLTTYTSGVFPQDYVPYELDYEKDIDLEERQIRLKLWEGPGPSDYDHIRPLGYAKTNVFLLCFCIVTPLSFENIRSKWYPEVRHHCPKIPLILVGTKMDLKDDKATCDYLTKKNQQSITTEMAVELCKEINADYYIECSSLTQLNVREVFHKAIQLAVIKSKQKTSRRSCNVI